MKDRDEEEWLRQSRWVRGLARDVLGDVQRAEDVSQEALLAAWRGRWGEHRDSKGLRRWLAGTARNLAKMTIRSESNRRAREVEAGTERGGRFDASAMGGGSVFDERIEMQRRVAESVAGLGPEDREVVVLRYFDGLEPREIAKRLGTTPNAVSSRLSRARAKLREELDTRDPESRDLGSRDLGAWIVAASGLEALRSAGAVAKPLAHSGASAAPLSGSAWVAAVAMKKLAVVIAIIASLILLGGLWLSAGKPESAEMIASAPPSRRAVSEVALAPLADVTDPLKTPPRAGAGEGVPLTIQKEPAPREEEALPVETGAVLVTVVSDVTAELMPHVGLGVRTFSTSRWHDSQEDSTNARGQRLFASLPEGSLRVRAWRTSPGGESSTERQVEVAAGETTEVILRVGGGNTIRGVVVDEQGRAVGGAEIWMSQGNGFPGASLLAGYCDGRGRFEIAHAGRLHAVGARAPRMQPSLQEMPGVFKPVDPEVGVTLVLKSLGGELRGRVVTAEGVAVADAVVRIKPQGSASPGTPVEREGGFAYSPPEIVLRTDAAGAFSTDQLGSGSFRVAARGQQTDIGVALVEVAPGGSAEVEVIVGDAGSLMGTVTDHLGQPVAGAGLSITGADWDLAHAEATAGEDGTFLFPTVCTGEVRVTVYTDRGLSGVEGTVLIRPGQCTEWSPSMPAPLAIHGQALTNEGVPLAGFHVRGAAQDEQGPMATFLSIVREDGAFEAPRCLDAAYDLFLYPPGQWMGEALAELRGIPAGSVDARFELSDQLLPTASLTGRVLNSEGESVPFRLSVEGSRPVTRVMLSFSDASGRFRVPHLPPGEYALTFTSEGYAAQTIQLSPPLVDGEAREVPSIHLVAQ